MSDRVLFQFHWQNRDNPSQTEFVAQGGFAAKEPMEEWANGIIERRRSECPDGWMPALITEGHDRFVYATEKGPSP